MSGYQTEFRHYTVIAEGVAGQLSGGFVCRPGPAFMGMRAWASSAEESADMVRVIGGQIGFTVTGEIQIFESQPKQAPGVNPSGYDINFTPFKDDARAT